MTITTTTAGLDTAPTTSAAIIGWLSAATDLTASKGIFRCGRTKKPNSFASDSIGGRCVVARRAR